MEASYTCFDFAVSFLSERDSEKRIFVITQEELTYETKQSAPYLNLSYSANNCPTVLSIAAPSPLKNRQAAC